MINFKLDYSSCSRKIKQLIEDLVSEGHRELEEMSTDISETIREDKSFGGNRLRNNIRHKFARPLRLRSFTGIRYAKYIEYGTRPHIIRARRARFLRFMYNGEMVFRKQVNHPGNKPYKFFSNAHTGAYNRMSPRLIKRYNEAARRFSGR
jgi:hypothetical protein